MANEAGDSVRVSVFAKSLKTSLNEPLIWGIETSEKYPCTKLGVKTINEIRVQMTDPDHSKTCHPNLVACYQLVQSILKIGTALAERTE